MFNKSVPNKAYEVDTTEQTSPILPKFLRKKFKKKYKLYNKLVKEGKKPGDCDSFKSLEADCKEAKRKFDENWIHELEKPCISPEKDFFDKIKFYLGKTNSKEVILLKDKNNRDVPFDKTAQEFCTHFFEKLNSNSKSCNLVFEKRDIKFPANIFHAIRIEV